MPVARRSFLAEPIASPPECDSLNFAQVSPAMWECFKRAVSSQMNVTFPHPDRGQTSLQGSTVKYYFDTNLRSLTLTSGGSFFASCSSINQRITEYFTDCLGPSVKQVNAPAGQIKWRIDGPDVKQPDTAYSAILFRQGDRVRVDAGGCVQTGGRGQTWRLYVDPRGSQSDRFYHGLIKLPGMGEPLRIRTFVTNGNNYQINVNQGDMSLHLGYEDAPNGFANNGYWGHDDGIENQCRNVGKAWIEITIYR